MGGFNIGGMFNNVIPAAQNSYGVMQQLQQAQQQAQAKQLLGQLLQKITAQGQQPQAGAQPAGMYGPQQPGAMPMPSAVSPTMGGAPAAAGGAPGVAGPQPASQPGGGAPSLFGIDPAVVQAMQQMKGASPGAMGYLIGDVAKMSIPQDRLQDMLMRAAMRTDDSAANRDERGREANLKATTQELAIAEKAKQGHEKATQMHQWYLEKAREADQKSADYKLSAAERATASQDGITYRKWAMEEKAKADTAKRATNGKPAPLVKTQAEYDALPSGTQYMEDDGNTYTKP